MSILVETLVKRQDGGELRLAFEGAEGGTLWLMQTTGQGSEDWVSVHTIEEAKAINEKLIAYIEIMTQAEEERKQND